MITFARKDPGPVPSRRHARRGAKSSVNLTPREIAYILADTARGHQPSQVRRNFNAAFGRNINVRTVNYHTGWNPDRIAAYKADIAERGDVAVLAEVMQLTDPKTQARHDAPIAARFAAQLPPDYRPRPDDVPAERTTGNTSDPDLAVVPLENVGDEMC